MAFSLLSEENRALSLITYTKYENLKITQYQAYKQQFSLPYKELKEERMLNNNQI